MTKNSKLLFIPEQEVINSIQGGKISVCVIEVGGAGQRLRAAG